MPIVPIVIAVALVVAVLVAAIGPARSMAENRVADADWRTGVGDFVPLQWELLAERRFAAAAKPASGLKGRGAAVPGPFSGPPAA